MEHFGSPLQQWPNRVILLPDNGVVTGGDGVGGAVVGWLVEEPVEEALLTHGVGWRLHVACQHLLVGVDGGAEDEEAGVEVVSCHLHSTELVILKYFIQILSNIYKY